MTAEELNIIIRVNGQSSYSNAMRSVTRSTQGFDSSVGKLTSTLAKLVSAGSMIKFGKQCLTAASDLEEVANVVKVTFGEETAGIVNDWAKNQAMNFGLSEVAAKRYIGTFGTMATQFGMTQEQAAKMGIEITKLTGDVASFYNIDDKLASIKLKSIFTGETETLKELGVVMTEAQLDAYMLEKGYGKTVKQLNEHEKVMLRYQFVLDKLSHTQGDFARTSDGWANSTRLFKLQLENLKVEIGNQLLPVAGYALKSISAGISAISPALVYIAQTVRIYTEAWKQTSDTTKNFLKIGVAVFSFGMLIPRVVTLVSGAVKLLTVDITTLSMALKSLAGIAGILLAIVAVKSLSDSVKDIKAQQAVNDVKSLGDTSGVASGAVDDLTDSVNGLSDSAKGLDTFLAPFDEVNKIGDNGSLMSSLLTAGDLDNILQATTGLDDITDILNEINGNTAISYLNSQFDTLSKNKIFTREFWSGYLDYLSKWFGSGEWKNDMEYMLTSIDNKLGQWFPTWTHFWEQRGQDVYDMIQKVKEKFQALVDDIKIILGYGDEADETGVSGLTPTGKEHYLRTYAIQSTGGVTKRSAGGLPNKGSLFYAGDAGPELIEDIGGGQTRVLNQSQMQKYEPQKQDIEVKMPDVKPIVNVYPTIEIDGRAITRTVVNGINTMTRSAGNSPLIQLG